MSKCSIFLLRSLENNTVSRALGEWCMVKKFVQNLEFTEILRIFAPEKEIHV